MAFRAPYHPSPSSTSIGGDMDRGASNYSTTSFQQQFPPQSQFAHSPQSLFHDQSPYSSQPYQPYGSQPYGMKQSMSDFSTTHGHDTEAGSIDPVRHDEPEPEMDTPGKPSLLMRLRKLIPNSFYCRLYLLAVTVEAVIDVVIEGVI